MIYVSTWCCVQDQVRREPVRVGDRAVHLGQRLRDIG
jgi:hypothetical protein